MNDVDEATARALGWPKSTYAWVERERRWLCRAIPMERVQETEEIEDLYVTDTQLRLRAALPANGSAPMLRLGRKADVSASVRLLTSIYLSQHEFDLLSVLPGSRLSKTRHYLGVVDGAKLSIDQFHGPLQGLIMAEAEFESVEEMDAYPMPDFASEEVTDDIRYTGGCLAMDGIPR